MENTKIKVDPEEVVLNGGPTQPKLLKLSSDVDTAGKPSTDLSFNPIYTADNFKQQLRKQWNSEDKCDFKDEDTQVQLYTDPFQICLIPNFLRDQSSCRALVDEMVEKVIWSRKQMDLYEFYQSADLSSLVHCKLLTNFLQMLRRTVRPWLEEVTNLKLDYVSASCSMYTCGDYLLVHDDLLKDRQVAFVYYLSPWEGAEQWQETQGGCLEIFESDSHCFPYFPVKRKICPLNNQFACFKVGARSFHQVGEVKSFDYPRLTINGWFHGDSNDEHNAADTLRPITKLLFEPPKAAEEIDDLKTWINAYYLKPHVRTAIQKRIEKKSATCLFEFLNNELYKEATSQLLNDNDDDKLVWRRRGPANAQNYEVLDTASADKTIASLLKLFRSEKMFELLRDFTDLDLAGPMSKAPSCSVELQRWSHGNYTVLGDGAMDEENTLDILYYINADRGAGIVTYLSPEEEETATNGDYSDGESSDMDESVDDSILLTITPVNNAFNMVYRNEGTTRFTKYVSHNTPLEKGPVFILACSYKE